MLVVMMKVNMLSAIMLSDIMLSGIMLGVKTLSCIVMNVIMMGVIRLNVVAPFQLLALYSEYASRILFTARAPSYLSCAQFRHHLLYIVKM